MKCPVCLLLLCVCGCLLCACNGDCRDVICFNNGQCKDGACICEGRYGGEQCDSLCPVGLEGLHCDVDSRDKFIGTWQADTRDAAGNHVYHSITILKNASMGSMKISNYNNLGFDVNAAILDPEVFSINTQFVGSLATNVQGAGYKNGSHLAINLSYNGENFFADCSR